MKKIVSFFFFVSIICNCIGQNESGLMNNVQATSYMDLLKMTKEYFRSNPYNIEFGRFVNHLMNDPTIANKKINKKTDTSFFSFKGEYKNYSPFSFKADRTEINLAEVEFLSDDSLVRKDTMFVYQLSGYSYEGKEGMETVKKEFTKFNRRFGKNFLVQSSNIEKQKEIIGGLTDYFVPGVFGSPLSAGWGKIDELQNVFVITIRMKIKENLVQLPLSFDSH
jgi:hypothetical protein